MYSFLININFRGLECIVEPVCTSRLMKNKIYFIDFLNVRYSYRQKSVSSILRAFDRTLQGNCKAYYYCIPFGKGYDFIDHTNTFYLPEGEDDDKHILRFCEKSKGFVVSRDKFRNYPEYDEIIQKRRLYHTIRNCNLNLIHASRMNGNQFNSLSSTCGSYGRYVN